MAMRRTGEELPDTERRARLVERRLVGPRACARCRHFEPPIAGCGTCRKVACYKLPDQGCEQWEAMEP